LTATLLKTLSVTTFLVIIKLQLCQWKGLWYFQVHLITVKEDREEPVAHSRQADCLPSSNFEHFLYIKCFVAYAKLRPPEYKCSSLICDVLYWPLLV